MVSPETESTALAGLLEWLERQRDWTRRQAAECREKHYAFVAPYYDGQTSLATQIIEHIKGNDPQ